MVSSQGEVFHAGAIGLDGVRFLPQRGGFPYAGLVGRRWFPPKGRFYMLERLDGYFGGLAESAFGSRGRASRCSSLTHILAFVGDVLRGMTPTTSGDWKKMKSLAGPFRMQ